MLIFKKYPIELLDCIGKKPMLQVQIDIDLNRPLAAQSTPAAIRKFKILLEKFFQQCQDELLKELKR
jgi:hypothetical protein